MYKYTRKITHSIFTPLPCCSSPFKKQLKFSSPSSGFLLQIYAGTYPSSAYVTKELVEGVFFYYCVSKRIFPLKFFRHRWFSRKLREAQKFQTPVLYHANLSYTYRIWDLTSTASFCIAKTWNASRTKLWLRRKKKKKKF